MFWFISFIISVLILGTLMFFSYPQKREREDEYTCWNKSPWVDEDDKRVPVPVWMIIIACTVSVIPIVNLVCSVITVLAYCLQYSGKDGMDGYELIDRRIELRAPYLRWIKWLNKEI